MKALHYFLVPAVFLALFSSAQAQSESSAELQKLLAKGQNVPAVDARIELFSGQLLGKVYSLGPLGEGPNGKYDRGPLYRFDSFDCTTFIETVMALSLSRDATDFDKNLKKLRYKNAEVDFAARNHFPDLDWMPNNIANGMVADAMTLEPGIKVQSAEVDIDKAAWFRNLPEARIQMPNASGAEKQKLLGELHEESNRFKTQKVKVNFVSFKDIFHKQGQSYAAADGFFAAIPSGTFVNFVIKRRPRQGMGTTMLIWHQGILIRKNGELWIRHAANLSRRVIEAPALDFFLYEFLGHQWDGAVDAGVNLFRLQAKEISKTQ